MHAISLPSKEMGRECIEEGELSTPLVAKDEHHQVYGSGTSSGDHVCADTTGCGGGGESQSGSSSATSVVVLITLVAFMFVSSYFSLA